MKKLMIAAAAAAMIGGAYAELAYDYTASLKTTTGKAGKTTATHGPWNLGVNDAGDAFWYNDPIVANALLETPEYFTTKTVGGTSGIPCLTSEAKKDLIWLTGTLNINYLASIYDNKSANKWCETVDKIKTTDEGCYRVAGSKKITNVFYLDDCCTDVYTAEDGTTLEFALNNRFGAFANKDKATKVEVVGCVNDWCFGTDPDTFTVAGQGTWSDKLAKVNGVTYAGVKSISGNIVGVLVAPNCKSCCSFEATAYAWECDDTSYLGDDELPTAAYGTWTLKFNKSKSDL